MEEKTWFSRPIAAAENLAGHIETHQFVDKRILLTGESEIIATNNGQECLFASMLLMTKICRNVSVMLPEGHHDIELELHRLSKRIPTGSSFEFINKGSELGGFNAILSVGKTANPGLPWTVINSNGWLCRLSSGRIDLDVDCSQSNPVGALAAASLGVTEIFKRLVGLKPSRGLLLEKTTFNLYTYGIDDINPGLPLPVHLPVNLLIVGSGAIGNGVIYLLSKLTLEGTCIIVDKQAFGPENIGTSILVGPEDVGKDKAIFAASSLKGKIQATGFREEIGTFTKRLGTEFPYPELALGCLDSIDARHSLQDLWIDKIIDGAISDFACQVSYHPWVDNIACLKCYFRKSASESAESVASRVTGLSLARSSQQLDTITEEDISDAPPEKRAWLHTRIGKQICSVIQEAVLGNISDREHQKGFQPSVPFVACMSACMVVTELVKSVTGWHSDLEPCFQMDMLRGPAQGQFIPQERRKDCVCVTRKKNIELLRANRQAKKGN
jgi:hypothetical protein